MRAWAWVAPASFILAAPPAAAADPLLSQEAPAPRYRKVVLNGATNWEPAPHLFEASDSQPEETFVDALTLRLHHSLTDVYVGFLGDLAVAVRRNVVGDVWRPGPGAVSPAERPDRPFGVGWTSGIGASLQLIEHGDRPWAEAWVNDEEGTPYHFIGVRAEGGGGGGGRQFFPVLDTGCRQDARLARLERTADGHFRFVRRFGTTLRFEAVPAPEEGGTAAGTGAERTRFFRLAEVRNPSGVSLVYRYAPGNRSAVPDELGFRSCVLRIEKKNGQGLVSRVIDPRGNAYAYGYREIGLPDGGSAHLLVTIDGPERHSVKYGYEVIRGADAWHFNLAEITDARGKIHRIDYQEDPRPGLRPRMVRRVTLPGSVGVTEFRAPFRAGGPSPYVATVVVNAAGHAKAYEFRQPGSQSYAALVPGGGEAGAPQAPVVRFYRRMVVKRYEGSGVTYRAGSRRVDLAPGTRLIAAEAYEFDPGCGLGLARVTDLSRHNTEFTCGDRLPPWRFRMDSPGSGGGLFERYQEVTQVTDAMGHVTRYTYGGPFHRRTETHDAEGRIRVLDRSDATGEVTALTVFASAADRAADRPFFREESFYENPALPGFRTRRVIRKLPRPGGGPDWEVDLVTVFKADELGRVTEMVKDPGGLDETTKHVYDPSNNVIQTTYWNGEIELYGHDGRNRTTLVSSPVGEVYVRYTYDPRGNKVREDYRNGTVRRYEYDPHNRLIVERTEHPDRGGGRPKVSVTTYSHSALNSVVLERGADLRTVRSTYDAGLRLVRQVTSDGEDSKFSYGRNHGSFLFEESMNSPTRLEQPNTWPLEVDYDPLNRKVAAFNVIEGKRVQTARFAHDKVGNLLLEEEDGVRAEFVYDAMDRVVEETRSDGTRSRHRYTSTGLHYATESADGEVDEWRFDAAGDPIGR